MGALDEHNRIALFPGYRGFHHSVHQLLEFRDIAHIVMAGNKACLAAAKVQMKAQSVKVAHTDGSAVVGRSLQHAQGNGVRIHDEFGSRSLCQLPDFLTLGFDDAQKGWIFNVDSCRILVQPGFKVFQVQHSGIAAAGYQFNLNFLVRIYHFQVIAHQSQVLTVHGMGKEDLVPSGDTAGHAKACGGCLTAAVAWDGQEGHV